MLALINHLLFSGDEGVETVNTTLVFNQHQQPQPAFIEKKAGPVPNVLVSFSDPDVCDRVTYAKAREIFLEQIFPPNTLVPVSRGQVNEVWRAVDDPGIVVRFAMHAPADAYEVRNEAFMHKHLHSMLPMLVPDIYYMVRVQYRNFDNNRFEFTAVIMERLDICESWQTCGKSSGLKVKGRRSLSGQGTSTWSDDKNLLWRANSMVLSILAAALTVIFKGVYHGDLNLGNVVLTSKGVRLIDFENACLTRPSRGPSPAARMFGGSVSPRGYGGEDDGDNVGEYACSDNVLFPYNRSHGFMAVEMVLRGAAAGSGARSGVRSMMDSSSGSGSGSSTYLSNDSFVAAGEEYDIPPTAVSHMLRLYTPAAKIFYPQLFSGSNDDFAEDSSEAAATAAAAAAAETTETILQKRIRNMYADKRICADRDVCFERSQVFIFAINAFSQLVNLTPEGRLELHNVGLLRPDVRKLLADCLHPVASQRPSADQLANRLANIQADLLDAAFVVQGEHSTTGSPAYSSSSGSSNSKNKSKFARRRSTGF